MTDSSKLAQSSKTRTPFRLNDWSWILLFVVMIGGWFFPLLGLAVPVCFLAPIIIAMFVGRKWCGNICPRGSFFDRLLSKLAPREGRIPRWARHWAVRLLVMAVLMGMLAVKLPPVWGVWEGVGQVFVLLLTVTTAVGIVMGISVHQRMWCAVCPAGSLASWVGGRRPPKLTIDASVCKKCKLCARGCPMNLQPYVDAQPVGRTHPDCLKCHRCVRSCPVQALSLQATVTGSRHVQEEAKAA